MNSSAFFTCLLLAGTTILAQDPLRIAGLDTTPVVWVQNIEDADASVRYDELAGEHTVLFVHTTIDETVAGPLVTAGIIKVLPFLASPTKSNWQLTAPELAAMSGFNFTGQQPMVPPRRIANHIAAFVATTYGPGYGTFNPASSGYETQATTHGMVAIPSTNEDERRSWANSTWTWHTAINEYSFDTVQLGRQSIYQAAYEYATLIPTLPPIEDAAIEALNALMDSKLGFEIYIQAAHITPPSSTGPIEVRISRHARIRRRSLHETTLGWSGPDRYVPHPTALNVNIWLAPLEDEMHIIFPVEIGTLNNPTSVRAYVPTTTGLCIVDQTPNPVFLGQLIRPDVGIFQCPANTIAGTVYFELLTEPGLVFSPIGDFNRGAFIIPFTPPLTPPGNGVMNGNTQPVQ